MGSKRRAGRQLLSDRFAEGGDVHCDYCDRVIRLEKPPSTAQDRAVADHRIPLSRGGRDHPDNLAVVCAACDAEKGPLTAEEFLALRADPVRLGYVKAVISTELNGQDIEMAPTRKLRRQAKRERSWERRGLTHRLTLPQSLWASIEGTEPPSVDVD